MPPGAMTVSMSAADGISSPAAGLAAYRSRKGDPDSSTHLVRPVRPDRAYGSTDDVRYRRIRERSLDKVAGEVPRDPNDYRQNMRASSWNRQQKRNSSNERGGAQLPTWAETRTTRLRRSKALGEVNKANANQKPKKPAKTNVSPKRTVRRRKHFDAEDEAEDEDDPGRYLMERIRANSRCLKAQISAHQSRRATREDKEIHKDRTVNAIDKSDRVRNGIYAVHTRRNKKYASEKAEVESTSVRLLDDEGRALESATPEQMQASSPEEPEIVRVHTLSADGEGARTVEVTGSGRGTASEEKLENIAEGTGESSESKNASEIDAKEPPNAEQGNPDENDNDAKSPDDNPSPDLGRQSEDSSTQNEEYNSSNDLEEGRLVNQNGHLTIEVEVKEIGTSEDSSGTPASATVESNLTPLPIDDTGEFDSYRVYSEQNVQSPTLEPTSGSSSPTRRLSRSDASKNDPIRIKRAKEARGIYLRRMEHRNSQSNIHRTQSNEQVAAKVGGSPSRTRYGGRSISYNRKSGQRRLEKWSTTAASTGDLREAAWDYSNDKERLLVILNEVRTETRLRQKQREELLRRIKQLQSRAHQRREQVREMWRKRYIEARKITPRLEEECSRLRQELEKLHRELLAKVQAGVWALLTISGKTERPSNKLSYKIMIARLLQEIEDLTRRVEATRLKLHTEVKLRSMAEKDVRNLREELLKKKIQVTLTRNQEQAAMGNGLRQQYFISAV